jgi:hypothetical protein
VFFTLNRDTLGCWVMRCQTPRRRVVKPFELPFRILETAGQFPAGRRNDMNDKNKQSQSQGQEVPPDPFPELDSFVVWLTPEKLKDTSLEDKEREENLRFADQLHAKALSRGDKTAIELDRLVQGRISTARSSDHW